MNTSWRRKDAPRGRSWKHHPNFISNRTLTLFAAWYLVFSRQHRQTDKPGMAAAAVVAKHTPTVSSLAGSEVTRVGDDLFEGGPTYSSINNFASIHEIYRGRYRLSSLPASCCFVQLRSDIQTVGPCACTLFHLHYDPFSVTLEFRAEMVQLLSLDRFAYLHHSCYVCVWTRHSVVWNCVCKRTGGPVVLKAYVKAKMQLRHFQQVKREVDLMKQIRCCSDIHISISECGTNHVPVALQWSDNH